MAQFSTTLEWQSFTRWQHCQSAEAKERAFLTQIGQAARMAAEDGASGEQE